ncbi:MAG: cbb3-type cytochrome c oxidase subunit I [Chloroflexi bacterium]|nr:cbb3-type cytochrome c oxidase subunit I [Chloroflexota bacterium]
MPRLSVWMVRTALLYLGVGFTIGGLLLFNKGVYIDAAIWRLRPVHAEIALIGWTLQLALGVAFWILPRLTRTERYGRTWLAWSGYGLLNAGVLLLAAARWNNGPAELTLAGRVLELLAVAAFAVYLWPRVKPFGK